MVVDRGLGEGRAGAGMLVSAREGAELASAWSSQ